MVYVQVVHSRYNICTTSSGIQSQRNVEIEVCKKVYARVHISTKEHLDIHCLVLKFEHLLCIQ
jgi:hypothetical protein